MRIQGQSKAGRKYTDEVIPYPLIHGVRHKSDTGLTATHRTCLRCEQLKPIDQFIGDSKTCKSCKPIKQSGEKLLIQHYDENTTERFCPRCKRTLPIEQFYMVHGKPINPCKKCRSDERREGHEGKHSQSNA